MQITLPAEQVVKVASKLDNASGNGFDVLASNGNSPIDITDQHED